MTKKDYQQIALVFQDMEPAESDVQHLYWTNFRDRMSEMLWHDNSAFRPAQFKAACKRGANVRARNY